MVVALVADRGGVRDALVLADLHHSRILHRAQHNERTVGGKVLLPPAPERLGGDIAIVADPEGTPVGLLRWTYPETEEDEQ